MRRWLFGYGLHCSWAEAAMSCYHTSYVTSISICGMLPCADESTQKKASITCLMSDALLTLELGPVLRLSLELQSHTTCQPDCKLSMLEPLTRMQLNRLSSISLKEILL